MAWMPLLTEGLASRALGTASEIADTLEKEVPYTPLPHATGPPVLALLHAYLALILDDEGYADLAQRRLAQAIDALAEQKPNLGFFRGCLGTAWTVHHLERLFTGESSAELTAEIDDLLLQTVRMTPWRWSLDLISGLTGMGLYALSHPDEPFRKEVVVNIVKRLAELVDTRGEMHAWRTSAEPEGVGLYALGVAHGMAGIIGLLGRIWSVGIAEDDTQGLLGGAVDWLLSKKRPAGGSSLINGYVVGHFDSPSHEVRSFAWCAGDPGVAAALLTAGICAERSHWVDEAVGIGRYNCPRPGQDQISDITLCHGAAGLGHLYNRIFQETGEILFLECAHEWLTYILESRQPGHTSSSWWNIDQHRKTDYLESTAGAGLALLSAASGMSPHWDGPMFLASEWP